jgi:integrase
MARTKRSAKLDTRNARLKLALAERHQEPLSPGRYLVYRRPSSGAAGSWSAYCYDAATHQKTMVRLGTADDFQDADGSGILAYAQAQAKAKTNFEAQDASEHLRDTGETLRKGPYTVKDAIRDYLQDAERRGVKGHKIMTLTCNAHIVPALGDLVVAKLTKRKIETWLHELAVAPRRRTGRAREDGGSVEHLAPPVTEDEKRARKDTANRILTNLCAALNYARRIGQITGVTPWREVGRFKNVGAVRVRFLSVEEQRRLVNVCRPGFRELVQAALFTGCRYGELGRLAVRDFNAEAGTIFIETSKSGKPRQIVLTQEGTDWFKAQVAGKTSLATLLTRPNATGAPRKGQPDPFAWGDHDQKKLMCAACTAAELDPLGFHELRHTYASGLVNAGVPLAYVAAQLGHVNTNMVEKHYGHLCPNALALSIRRLSPALQISEARVEPLKIKGA